jgi:nucleoid-associated protein YgaU
VLRHSAAPHGETAIDLSRALQQLLERDGQVADAFAGGAVDGTLARWSSNAQDGDRRGKTRASTEGDTLMSEGEKSQGLSSGMWMGIGIVGVFLAGGCLLACLGLLGLGFALPAVQQARQAAAQAEVDARQAAEAAAQQAAEETARTVESPAAKAEEDSLKEGTTQPEQDETPPKNADRPHNE